MHAFDVLGDPVRRRILEVLADGELTSGAVTAVIRREFGITQAGVSQHLRVLRESGFATVSVDGPRRIYAVQAEPLQEVDAWLSRFRGFWAHRLDALEVEISRGKRARPNASLPTDSADARPVDPTDPTQRHGRSNASGEAGGLG